MTKETRTLIELGDIEGIELECGACMTKVLYPLDGTGGEKMAERCPNPRCPAPESLFVFQGAEPMTKDRPCKAVDDIAALSRAVKSLAKGRADLKAKVRLQLSTLA
jgi:hypothetical protein